MEKYYVLERFALMKTSVISTLEGMAAKQLVPKFDGGRTKR